MDKDRFYKIRPLMDEAYDTGNTEEAELLALEYLTLADKHTKDWNYGNAIHHANLILGRIALRKGNLVKAKEYLIKAGNTVGSPQLNSFGPNMSLARELLEEKETEIVIEYIDLTRKFWVIEHADQMVQDWKKDINDGKLPNFRGNLIY